MSNQRSPSRWALTFLNCALFAALLTPPAQVAAQEQAPIARHAPLFDFHSNFWVNLHQVLFHEALLRGKPNRQLQNVPALSAAGMSKQEEGDWNAAVDFYAAHFGTRQQHGDDELIQINDSLAEQRDNRASLSPAGLPQALVPVLQNAAAVYRKYWWPAHDKSNQAWIASQQERVQTLGPKLAAAMTRDLQQQWPTAPIREDVCYYVVALGYAFTTLDPSHTTFSGFGPSNQDLSGSNRDLLGFELLFHEASHTFAATIANALSAEGRAQHKDVGDLWHAVLFYTSGVELRRLLPTSEQAAFTPYAYRYGVYAGGWAKYRPLLESDWQAYLDGKTNFADAIRSMVARVP